MNSLIAYVFFFFYTTAHREEMTLFIFCSSLYMCSWGMFACFFLAVSSNSSQFLSPCREISRLLLGSLGMQGKRGLWGERGKEEIFGMGEWAHPSKFFPFWRAGDGMMMVQSRVGGTGGMFVYSHLWQVQMQKLSFRKSLYYRIL